MISRSNQSRPIAAIAFCAISVMWLLGSKALADNYPVLFTKQKGNVDNLYLLTSGGDLSQVTDHPRKDSSPMVSPDGRYIVFTSERVGWWKIWKLDLQDRSLSQLTDSSSAEYAPCWSPTGDRIAFVSSRDGDADIYVMDSDGANIRNVSNNSTGDGMPFWHSDNRIYYSSEIDGTYQVVSTSPHGDDRKVHSTGRGDKFMPQLSSLDNTLLFYSDMDGNFEIYSGTLGGNEVTRLTNDPLFDIRARWSPDGKKIVFERGDKQKQQQIFSMNRDGSQQAPLSDRDYNYAPVFVSNCDFLCSDN